jgi:hypothetical protein
LIIRRSSTESDFGQHRSSVTQFRFRSLTASCCFRH